MVHHIYVYGIVGYEATAISVLEQIKSANPQKDDTVICHIHSPGGFVSEGFAIHDLLKSQANTLGFKLETQAEGECKSIATVIFLAANVRKMTSNSDFMIHNPWAGSEGDADTMRKVADDLEKEEERLAAFYSQVTGANVDTIRQFMAAETYYTPDQALEMNFATEIIDTMKAVAMLKVNSQSNKNQMSKKTIELKGWKALVAKAAKALEALATEAKALEATLEDGTSVTIETEAETPSVGDAVIIAESGEAAPDGSHTLSDGTVIVTSGGVITEINPESDASDVEAMQARIDELEQALAEVQPVLQALAKAEGKPAPKAKAPAPRAIVTKVSEKPKASFTKDQIKANRRRTQA